MLVEWKLESKELLKNLRIIKIQMLKIKLEAQNNLTKSTQKLEELILLKVLQK